MFLSYYKERCICVCVYVCVSVCVFPQAVATLLYFLFGLSFGISNLEICVKILAITSCSNFRFGSDNTQIFKSFVIHSLTQYTSKTKAAICPSTRLAFQVYNL